VLFTGGGVQSMESLFETLAAELPILMPAPLVVLNR
jgi:hypothetical protein